jgi:hypothetical protein
MIRVMRFIDSGWALVAAALGAGVGSAQSVAAAAPAAVVVEGHARFTVLTPEMVRMEWSPEGKFEDRASLVFVNRKMPVPAFTKSERGGVLRIKTAALEVVYSPKAGGKGDGGKFDDKTLSVALMVDGKSVEWHPGMVDAGNLMGTTRTLDGAKGGATKEPIGEGLLSRDGWAVVDDSRRPLFDSDDFAFKGGETSEWPWVVERPKGTAQDIYFMGYGHAYKQALSDFVKVAGRIPLPPRFAFGAWWSRYWSYSDQELEGLVKGFQENDVPMDVLVIDMGWHPDFHEAPAQDQAGERKGWTGYSWNKILFPDPKAFLDTVHGEGLKATLNLHPAGGVEPWEDAYPAMARAMGIDPATGKYVPFDITNKKFAVNYMDILHHPLEKQGIDFWWLDWQQKKTVPIEGLSVTWWLNYVHFTDQEREGKRPLLFHRWGGLGNHRYQIGFSGDTVSVWDSLQFQPGFTAQAANVGYAYWSHDIGGHMPGAVSPELYARWIQFGAFSPILRTHTTSNPDAERRIWAYPEPYADVMRQAFRLRYDLQPYLYTEARRTYDTGVAFDHPLYYDWPEAAEAYANKDEYVFGDGMIVKPVTAPADTATGLATEDVWLPEGSWVEWMTGKKFTGPVTVKRTFSIAQIPVYVRAGAVVPMMPKMEFTGEKPVDPLIANVWPLKDGQKTSYRVYEDSGDGVKYKDGVCAWTAIEASRTGAAEEVVMKPVEGSFPGMLRTRGFEVRLPGDWPPSAVTVNGVKLGYVREEGKVGWRFDGNTLTTIVTTGPHAVTEAVTVTVERDAALLAREGEIDGFAGKMSRWAEAGDVANHAGGGSYAPDSLLLLLQAGDRIGYRPETAGDEVARLGTMYAAALKETEASEEASRTEAVNRTGGSDMVAKGTLTPEDEMKTRRTDEFRKAVALLKSVGNGD